MKSTGMMNVPSLDNMLTNVSIVASILPGKVGDAADKVGSRHVDRKGVGQRGEDRVEFTVPEGGSAAINGTTCCVAVLLTVGSDSPAILADRCCHDRSRCRCRLDIC